MWRTNGSNCVRHELDLGKAAIGVARHAPELGVRGDVGAIRNDIGAVQRRRNGSNRLLRDSSGRLPSIRISASFEIALICTTRRQIPASASTNQGPEKDDLIPP